MDVTAMINNLKVAMVASDADFNIIYVNKRGEEIFKQLLNAEDLVGKNMAGCHKPETMEKLKGLYQAYREKKLNLDYYTMDIPGGKLTIVNVPFYEAGEFSGVVEYIFESSLA